jgi:hypothetical protein
MPVSITLQGSTVVSTQQYNDTLGEVTFWGDFKHGNLYFTQLPFLRLVADRELFDSLIVDDEYHQAIPYLKQSAEFRKFMLVQAIPNALKDPRISGNTLLQTGLLIYADRLKSFSTTKSLVAQVKRTVNRLDPEKGSSRVQARAILKVLDVPADVDLGFFWNQKG